MVVSTRVLETISADKNIIALRYTIDDPLCREMFIIILKLDTAHISIIARPGFKQICGILFVKFGSS